MKLSQVSQLRGLRNSDYSELRRLCRKAKNLYNVGLYSVKKFYKQEGKYLPYEGNYHVCKDNENYKELGTDIAQNVLKSVDRGFKAFFTVNKRHPELRARPPKFLEKSGLFSLIFPVRNQEKIKIPKTSIVLRKPKNISGRVAEVRIIPKFGGRYFEVAWIYEKDKEETPLHTDRFLGVDFGIDNLATCVSSFGTSFIVDGRRLKSVNYYFAKKFGTAQKRKASKSQSYLRRKHGNILKDYINKAARKIIDYCLSYGIGTLVVGYNKGWKVGMNIGKVNNQKFGMIPHGKLRQKLEYLCDFYGIRFVEQEESYTSKSSFRDNDPLPVINLDSPREFSFSGKRVKRGLYKTSTGALLNSDVNGAANILRKCKLIGEEVISDLQCNGFLDNPQRIRIN